MKVRQRASQLRQRLRRAAEGGQRRWRRRQRSSRPRSLVGRIRSLRLQLGRRAPLSRGQLFLLESCAALTLLLPFSPLRPWEVTSRHFTALMGLFLFAGVIRRAKATAAGEQAKAAKRDFLLGYSLALLTLTPSFGLLQELATSEGLITTLLVPKLIIDGLSGTLEVCGRPAPRARLRAALNELTILSALALQVGWAPRLITPALIEGLLVLSCAAVGLLSLVQLRLLQKRFIADALSLCNLLCGVASIYFSFQHRYESSLLFLLLGAAFDGFDGAAARRFGGTPWGVYADDIADGVNYGIAPAFALYCLLGPTEGIIIAPFYALFTIGRLVFFTLNKGGSDPNYFSGIPSPVGGMIVMSAVVLFQDALTWVTFLVGISSTLMVSFSTPYRHLGRALGQERRA
ncbi:MAG: CDP-alcohol phosphatidyltransferase family protein, partial [Myxococcota bacterium]|nr:CDP-alcohol phosphatidyltransferase family protein [Myxococcota bacterium]